MYAGMKLSVTLMISFGAVLIIYCSFLYTYRESVRPFSKEHYYKTEEVLRPDHALALHKYDGVSEDIRESGMHLITNYPLMPETPWIEAQKDTNKSRLWERQLEIEEVLQRNLNNTLVTTVHLLVNQPSAEQRLYKLSFHNKRKIVVRRIESLPKYKNFFDYINEKLLNRFVVMLNMDIYVGEGFELLNRTFLVRSNICYVYMLTRHGRQERRCNDL